MSVQSQPLRSTMLPILAAGLLMLSSCSFSFEVDPATTVTVEIIGVNDEEDRDDIRETLIGMTDGSSHMMTSSASGDKMTVELSPVEDIAAFSRKINFGEVIEVDGRTVKVSFVK
jgi:hypothetical protein